MELRRKLEDEHASYKRKLQAYQDGQQRQAQLVQKLQAKVTIEGTNLNHILRPRLFSDQVEDWTCFEPPFLNLILLMYSQIL